jgi:hypothetical protein
MTPWYSFWASAKRLRIVSVEALPTRMAPGTLDRAPRQQQCEPEPALTGLAVHQRQFVGQQRPSVDQLVWMYQRSHPDPPKYEALGCEAKRPVTQAEKANDPKEERIMAYGGSTPGSSTARSTSSGNNNPTSLAGLVATGAAKAPSQS